jgi:hypothetical protein
VIIAMTNQPMMPAPQLAPREIESLFFGDQTITMPPAGIDVERETREALAGTYVTTGGTRIDITPTADGLEARASDPALFGGMGALRAPGGRAAALEERTLRVLEASTGGNFAPIYEAFVVEDGRTLDDVSAEQRRIWEDWRTTYGAYKGLELLGTGTAAMGDPAVTVRIVFEHGGPVMQYVWGPRRLFLVREVPADPVTLVAEAPGVWTFYSYRLPKAVTLRFGDEGTLEIDGLTGRVTARR